VRKSIAIVALSVLALPAANVRADFIPPTGFPAGTTEYEILFVTSGGTPATSSSISYYNTFVTNQAALDSSLPTTTWNAIISTSTVNAATNAPDGTLGSPIPVYNTAGQLLNYSLASGLYSLYAGEDLQQAPLYNEMGVSQPLSTPWTGSNSDGTADIHSLWAGSTSGDVVFGYSAATDFNWIRFGAGDETIPESLYALSSPISDTSSSPEPASITLLASGLFAAGGFGLYRRRLATTAS
jgi:hypothetical protein